VKIEYDPNRRGRFINLLTGKLGSGYIELSGEKEYITDYVIEYGKICPSKIANKARKERGWGYDTIETKTYSIYKLIQDRDYKEGMSFNTNILGTRIITTYKLNNIYSRVDGPCIIDTGIKNENSAFYCKSIDLWAFKGEIIPDWAPKIFNGGELGDWSEKNILKSMLIFNREYSNILMDVKNKRRGVYGKSNL